MVDMTWSWIGGICLCHHKKLQDISPNKRKQTDIHFFDNPKASGKSDGAQAWTTQEACSPASSIHYVKPRGTDSVAQICFCVPGRSGRNTLKKKSGRMTLRQTENIFKMNSDKKLRESKLLLQFWLRETWKYKKGNHLSCSVPTGPRASRDSGIQYRERGLH